MNPYIPLLMLFVFAGLLGAGFIGLSQLLGPKKKFAAKMMSYECGINSTGSAHEKFPVKFYLVAMLFILFDVEVVFLYPWAVLFKEFLRSGAGVFLCVEMLVFMGILAIGLVYVYGHKAIDWK